MSLKVCKIKFFLVCKLKYLKQGCKQMVGIYKAPQVKKCGMEVVL